MPTIVGTAGADTLRGDGASDRIEGLAGNDVIVGNGGTDTLIGGDGDDRFVFERISAGAVAEVDGGAGTDTLDFSGYNSATYFFSQPLTVLAGSAAGSISLSAYFYQRGGPGRDEVVANVTGVERIILGVGTGVSLANHASALTIETTAQSGSGITTGRGDDTIILNPVGNMYGGSTVDAGAGTDTLVLSGTAGDYLFQKTASGWAVYDGAASVHQIANVELVRFGSGPTMSFDAAAAIDFDADGYVRKYADVRAAVGSDAVGAFRHFQQYGEAEGRTPVFDGLAYIAGYRDLIVGLGANATAGLEHFSRYGAAEGRSIIFNPAEYAAAHLDLARIIGTDAAQASTHYIAFGAAEGRVTAGFDSVAYLLSNSDLGGMTPVQARDHWLAYGADEGRAGDSVFGREQTSHVGFSGNTDFNVTRTLVSDFDRPIDRDWFTINLMNELNYVIDGSANVGSLAIYDKAGRLIAMDADGQDFAFKSSVANLGLVQLEFYLVVTGSGSPGAYSVSGTMVYPPSSQGLEEASLKSSVAETAYSANDPDLVDMGNWTSVADDWPRDIA